MDMLETCKKLRAALVQLVGVDGMEDLQGMEAAMRLAPAPMADKAAAIDAVHVLIETLWIVENDNAELS